MSHRHLVALPAKTAIGELHIIVLVLAGTNEGFGNLLLNE